MAGNLSPTNHSTSELASNFSEIRIANRSNIQQMEQLFNSLTTKSAEYRELWRREEAKNASSKKAILQLYEEGVTIILFPLH